MKIFSCVYCENNVLFYLSHLGIHLKLLTIHLKLVFIYMMWVGVKILFIHMQIFIWLIYWKVPIFPFAFQWHICWKTDPICGSVSRVSILFHWSICLFLYTRLNSVKNSCLLEPQNVALFGNRVFVDYLVKMKSYWD